MTDFTAKLILFSPTGTTRKIVNAIARGLNAHKNDTLDLTLPDSNRILEEHAEKIIFLVGVPVYSGRIPELAHQRLQRLKSSGSVAIPVVVFGNREFEDSLLELSSLLKEAGFVCPAGAAFIGEHSFSSDKTPIAAGRPDSSDLKKAEDFGKKIRKILSEKKDNQQIESADFPGSVPYRKGFTRPGISPSTDSENCSMCGKCQQACPTGAISLNGGVITDPDKCILCMACVKTCPCSARIMDNPNILKLSEKLFNNCSARKEPRIFF